jgi:hypothetical protein
MANYNLTNQPISSSFGQLLQKDVTTSTLYDGTGSVVSELDITSSYALTASYAENVVDPTWDNIQDKPSGLVSGSSQVSYPELSNIPSGIVSGSSQVNLTDTTFVDGTEFMVLRTDGAGNLSFDYADRAQIEIRTDEAIVKGDPLYVTGFSSGENRVTVGKADASDPTKMPAYGVAYESVSQNTNTQMVALGTLQNIDTQTPNYNVGDTLYVAVGGGLTNVKPTGTNLIQNVGIVGRRQQNSGEILVSAIGRSNDLPNIQEGYLWVGNSDGVPTTVASSSITPTPEGLATTGSNTFNGDQTISGSVGIQNGDVNYTFTTSSLKIIGDTSSIPWEPLEIIAPNGFVGGQIKNVGTITGIATIGANEVSASLGKLSFGSSTTKLENHYGLPGAEIELQFIPGGGAAAYEVFKADIGGTTTIAGDTINLIGSSSANTVLDVTGQIITDTFGKTDGTSTFTGSFSGELSSSGEFRTETLYTNNISSIPAGGSSLEIDLGAGNIYTNPNGTINVGGGLFVTQSAESSLGTIVFSYPYQGLQATNGLVTQRFAREGAGPYVTSFEQTVVGVDFSYFKQETGIAMNFETLNNCKISFLPDGNFESTKILDQTVDALTSNGQLDSITISPYTGSNGTIYTHNYFGIQNYPSSNYDNAFVMTKFDSTFTRVNEVVVGEDRVAMTLGVGDDFNYDYINLIEAGGSSFANIKADTINLTGVQNFTGQHTFTGLTTNNAVTTNNAKVTMNDVLELGAQDPLPAGGVGQLAVSGSNLYFHNGTSWGQIN